MPNDAAPETVTPQVSSARFLTGDLIKICIGEIRQQQVPFGVLTEKEQQKVIDRVTDVCTRAAKQAATIIASLGRPSTHAEIESVTFKDGIKIVLTMSKIQADRHAIADATGDSVLLVLPSYGEIAGGDPPKPDPDQPELGGIEGHTA
jgi:hypothetical protein